MGQGQSAGLDPFLMMNIITTFPRYSDGEIHRAFIKEITTGFEFEKARESVRVEEARKEASSQKGKEGMLGKCVSVMPSRDWFRLRQKYGISEIQSKSFIKHFQNKFPDLSPHKV